MTTQRMIGRFIAGLEDEWAAGPPVEKAHEAFRDTMAVAIAGVEDDPTRNVLAYARPRCGPAGEAVLWIAPMESDAETAAFVNAVAAHALDYDDVAPAWRGHPSAVLFPALLALAQDRDVPGRVVLDAYVVGFEIGARLGHAMATHYMHGWHSTATIGVIAATAACCRLLRAPQETIEHALGLAVSQAAGPRANFGTTAKPLHAGFAAAAAVRATRLAGHGIRSAPQALDGPSGFADLYASGEALEASFAMLGQGEPEILASGLEPKLFPLCYAAHRAVAATLELHRELGAGAPDITAVSVEGSPGSHTPLLKRLPREDGEAKFSLETCIALALVDGGIGLESFSPASLHRPQVCDLARRVTVAEAERSSDGRWSEVRLALVGCRRLARRMDRVNSSEAEARRLLEAKFVDCLSSVGLAAFSKPLGQEITTFPDDTVTRFLRGPTMRSIRMEMERRL